MEEPQEPRPRPRIVDKRVSARPRSEAEAPPERAPGQPPAEHQPGGAGAPAPPPTDPAPAAPGVEGDLWTPEQEEAARRLAQELREVPSVEWILNVAVNLANVAAAKLDGGLLGDAQLAIDALAALVNGVGARLGSADAPLRQTLAQLQMAYAQSAASGPGPARPG